ncbi:MAG: hypothetical protein HLUCCX14_11250 [Marinobacter excellens HL-55]|uniref:Uncharacterized protein n=1 Tax=Marinobacter excellens HL-55 TaxID=1305731 RepID=A0A0P7ZG92_9GAMM|nr:MAG: hypothetical protein HLUCCX14_11250 [Marinobacter excellens HL-55]
MSALTTFVSVPLSDSLGILTDYYQNYAISR